MDKITISKELWLRLLRDLKEKGDGKRESAAFLLGPVTGRQVSQYLCMDALDPKAFESGIIRFNSSGFVILWEICKEEGLKVLADIHTHPGTWVSQSSSDEKHPMIHQAGHIAIIVPEYAKKIQSSLRGIGVYEYLGSKQWRTHFKKNKIIQIEK